MSIIGSPDRLCSACPLCGKATEHGFRPFCSQGCRDRDLVNWLGDAYRVPGAPAEPELVQNAPVGLDRQG